MSAPTKGSQPRILSSAEGTHAEAFSVQEWGLLTGIAAIWGSSFLWMEIGLESLRPGVIVMVRVLLGVAALGIFAQARRGVDRADLPRIAFLGLIWVGIPLSLFPIAQQWIDSSVAGMLNGAMPLTAAGWATLLLRRWPGRAQVLGLAVGVVGVVAVSWPELSSARSTALGAGLVIVAIILYGLAANLAVPLQQRYGALPVLLRAQLAALVIVVPFGLAHLPGSGWAPAPVLAMVPLGVLSTGLAFIMMANLVGRVGGTRGSVPIYLVPVVAIILGVALRGETVAPIALFGTLLVIIGAWLTSRKERTAAR
ncbi:MAG: DMT family transporter [Actinobacteria bacterium]|nr:DMT family transporter [Actinomycetota bacterium]